MSYQVTSEIIKDIVLATPKPYPTFHLSFKPDSEDVGQQSWLMLVSLKNLASHNPNQQKLIAEWINVVLAKINAAGVPCGLERVE